MKKFLLGLCCALSVSLVAKTISIRTGLVDSAQGKNLALLVGVSHGLPGIDTDLKNMKEIASHPSYRFDAQNLIDKQATVGSVKDKLTELSSNVLPGGTLFLYFSGHGNEKGILMQDRLMKITEIRQAIQKGREGKEALSRLVMMFDSCYSGALIDSVRAELTQDEIEQENQTFADNLVKGFNDINRDNTYWKKLFVFVSSRADETSAATWDGSGFTLALRKAFDESALAKSKVSEFVKKAQDYTVEYHHHPQARLVPASLGDELLVE